MATETELYLRDVPAFQRLDQEHLSFVAGLAESISLSQDDVVFAVGDDASSFYIVVEGTVALIDHRPRGRDFEIQTIGPREILGWSWMVPPYTYRFEARASTAAILMRFDAAAIRARCEQDTAFGYGVMRRIVEQMAERMNSGRVLLSDRILQLEARLAD